MNNISLGKDDSGKKASMKYCSSHVVVAVVVAIVVVVVAVVVAVVVVVGNDLVPVEILNK